MTFNFLGTNALVNCMLRLSRDKYTRLKWGKKLIAKLLEKGE